MTAKVSVSVMNLQLTAQLFLLVCRIQECENTAQAQAKSLSRLKESEPENAEALELMEDKWSAAAQDAAAVVQSKELQLQDVANHCQQAQALTNDLEELTAKLETLNT